MHDTDAAPSSLIVNADDFGLTTATSSAIVRAHREGIVTSTSILAPAPAFESGAREVKACPSLGCGIHLACVGEFPPVCPAASVPSLVARDGNLFRSWRPFLGRAIAGQIDADDLRREFSAQIELVLDRGIVPSHLDSHQNLHLWPVVGEIVLELGKAYGLRRIRLPRSRGRRLSGVGITVLARRFARRARQAGFSFPDAYAGFDEAGAMTVEVLSANLRRFADKGHKVIEIAMHPGADTDPARDAFEWHYQWGPELEALTATTTRELVDKLGFRLASFATAFPAPGAG